MPFIVVAASLVNRSKRASSIAPSLLTSAGIQATGLLKEGEAGPALQPAPRELAYCEAGTLSANTNASTVSMRLGPIC